MDKQLDSIEGALETFEMIYNFHDGIVGHNEITWKAVKRIADALQEIRNGLR